MRKQLYKAKAIYLFYLLLYTLYANAIWCQVNTSYSHPANDDEFTGPFPSWLNVKVKFGATGDGIHDDTGAIQAALNAISNDAEHHLCVVYLPAGTYRITETLQIKSKIRISVIGEDPASTIIKWDGAKDGTMFYINGVGYSRFNRICWDGKGVARYAINDSWDGKQDYFDTGNEFADDEFRNVGTGIHGGFSYHISFAETAIMRCKFISNTIAGVSLGNFNALDIWIWNSVFQDCAIGATNDVEKGAGNFKIYNSIFRRSTIADIKIGNTGEFSFRDNTSTGSAAFLLAGWNRNACSILLQSNTILDPVGDAVIKIDNQGPLTLLDNTVRSRPGAGRAVVVMDAQPNASVFADGNTFTVASPLQCSQKMVYNTHIVTPQSLHGLAEQALPGTQPNLRRTVFEVPANAGAAGIQQVINQASALVGKRPVVHLASGSYEVNSTLTIPAGSDVQLTGDGYFSTLTWTGSTAGPVLKIEGPSKATIRDLMIRGHETASGILATNIDQQGARIFTHESISNHSHINYLVNGTDQAQVLLTNAYYTDASEKAISVVGKSGAQPGNTSNATTVVYAGCGTDNKINVEVTNGGQLLIRDTWYESRFVNQFLHLRDASTFSIEGSHIANTNSNKEVPLVSLADFSGRATFVSSYITGRMEITGEGKNTQLLGLGIFSELNEYAVNKSNKQADIRLFNTWSRENQVAPGGSHAVADNGQASQPYIASMLGAIRRTHATVLAPLAAGITDLRMYRVFTEYCVTGMEFRGAE